MFNIERQEVFGQVCVWQGTDLKEEDVHMFVDYFMKNGWRVQFLETIVTVPDRDNLDYEIAGTGGRRDVFFAIHNDDIVKFAIPRLQMGIRWIEDVLDNEADNTEHSIYPARVKEYRSW